MKKGFLYSAVGMIIVLILFSVLFIRVNEYQSKTVSTDQILRADAFLKQFHNDLKRTLSITGYRSLIGIEEYVSTTGDYVNNLSSVFFELLSNGTINGTSFDVMEDVSISEFAGRMKSLAVQQGLDFDFLLHNVSLTHKSPFEILINATFSINASMLDGTRWDYYSSVVTSFSIEDLKDPMYTVGTNGRVPVVVRKNYVSRPFITSDNDTTNLQLVFNNSLYVEDTSGPSFLMRYEGNFSPSPFGIASLVDTSDLAAQNLVIDPLASVVDHMYFSGNKSASYNIVNMPSHFRLDDAHLSLYDATGKTT